MEFATPKELYDKLFPVFEVKKRLISITNYQITSDNIWYYLIENKWKKCHNLQISEIVNDIITIDLDKINTFLGGTK